MGRIIQYEPHWLTSLCIRDDEHDDLSEIPIVCVVTDLCASDYDVILPADVVRKLQAASVAVNVSICDLGAVCDVGTETNDPEVEDNTRRTWIVYLSVT